MFLFDYFCENKYLTPMIAISIMQVWWWRPLFSREQ